MRLFLSIFLISVLSCQNLKNENLIYNEKNISELEITIVARSTNFLMPTQLISTPNQLYVIDEGKEQFIHKFNSSFSKFEKSILNRGEGPNHFKNPPVVFNDYQDKFLNALELSTTEIFRIKGEGKEYLYDLPESLGLINQVKYVDQNQLVGKAGLSNGNLFYYDLSSNSLKSTRFTPALVQTIKEADKKFVFNSFIETNREENIVVEVMQYFDLINFYDASGEITKSIGEKEHQKFYQNNKGSFSGSETYLHYVDVTADKNYCYALYLGEKAKNANSESNKIDMTIRIFTWGGEYIKSFKLDKICTSIEAFDGDLYGIDPSNEQSPIFKIHIGEFE